MPKYKVNGRTFNIPDNEVDLFEADFPEAQLHYQTNDGRKFTIYANERKDFLSDFPDATELGWSETIKEQAKQTDPFQPEDNLAQPMFGSMSYQDNIGKPEAYNYYPSPLSEEGRADYEPISAEERSKQEYDMLMRQLEEFNASNGSMMDTYEAYEKAAKFQVNDGGFAVDTPERRYLDENSDTYHQRKMEKDELNDRIKNNSYFNQMRMAEADAANETVDAISNLMAQNEAENPKMKHRLRARTAMAMNPRGAIGLSALKDDEELKEYGDTMADLATAKRLYENTAQVYAAPINDGEDILKKFGQGFGQRADDLDFWTMGIIGIADDMNARAAFQKIQDKFGSVKEFANLSDAEIDALLTPSEQLLISAVMDNNAALYARKDNTAGAYEAGAGAADSLMFMAQFLLTGGIGDAATVGTAAHRRLVSWLGRKVGSMSNGLMKDVARGAVKLGVGTAESIGKALVMTPLMPHTYANIADKMMSFDDNGELMDTTDAIISGSIDALIETWSESTGDFVNKVLGVPGDITKGLAKKVLKNVDFSDWGRAMNAPLMKLLKQGGFNGFLGEMGEEFIGNATRSLIGTLAPGSGQDPEALKNFAQWEQLLVTAGSFAPMTIFGIGTSSAQYGLAKRKLNNAQKAFESMLREASYTEDQTRFIIDELLGSTDAHLTPERLVANFSPLLRELAFNDRFANNRTQAMQSAVDFMWQIARYRTFDGVYHRQEEQQRNDMLAEIQEGTGREFWTTRLSENAGLDGTAYETDEVRAVEFNDGRVAYVLGGDGVNNTVVYNDGQTGFLSEEQLAEGKANGSIVSDATMGLNDYLTQQVARVRMTEEEQRMFAERNTNIGQVRAQFPIDATVELGTTEAPIQGVVRQQTPNGVIVESPAGVSMLTWEELGHTIGIEVNPQTDAQMEEEAINNLEIADLQRRREREQRRAQRNTAAETALAEEQMLDEAENEGLEKPIPMKADGTVDQTAFWNESPARWAQWKTEQRQDGGAYASSYIQNAIGILEGQIAESEAAFLAESDFDAKDALEQAITQQRARLAELQDLAMQYMPSVIPTDTSAEATEEQTQPSEETTQPAAVMADRQKFELDAEYQRRLSLAKALAEKEMILKEYFEAISTGSMEAVVMNKQNYKQVMKDMGCDESAIEEVTNAIKEAEEEHTAVNALHVNDKIFVIAEYNYTVEQGRVSYVHERQHNITKRNPELIQRVLSLGLSRETLQKIVKTLSGTDFYDNKSDEVLADEILSSTMEIAYTFDDFSVTLSKLGIPIELINLINEINDEQRNDYSLANARRNTIQRNDRQGSSRQDVGDQGEVSGGILGEEGNGSQETGLRGAESGEAATGGAEASEEGLQVPLAEVEEEEPTDDDVLAEEGFEVDEQNEDVRFSVRFLPTPEQRKGLIGSIINVTGRTRDEAERWLASELSLASIVLNDKEYLDYAPDSKYKAIKDNSDYPQGTVDFNNICRKRKDFTRMYTRLQRAYPNRIFTAEDLADIRTIMSEDGLVVACGLCYVEDRRQKLGEVANEFIKDLQDGFKSYGKKNATKRANAEKFRSFVGNDTYIPSIYDLITLEGSDKLHDEHKGIWDAFGAYNRARGQQTQNTFQGYAEYKREILTWSDAKVKKVNSLGGLRIFSYSDFEAHHLLDIIQIIIDCAARGVMIQGYTKVPEFARVVEKTGIKLNRSLIPLGDTGIVDGKLAYDPVEGIDINDPNFLESNDNVGNILIGINDEQIRMAMADPFIHYIIPYHARQAGNIRAKLNVGAWTNYIDTQNERKMSDGKRVEKNINIYTDVLNESITNDREFVEKYLEVCREKGYIPKFDQFLNRDAEGNYVYTPGYYKFLVDFKLFDEAGNILPQKPVVAQFDDAFNAQVLLDYAREERETAGAAMNSTYDKIVETLDLGEPTEGDDIRFSIKASEGPIDLVEEAKKADLRHRVAAEGTLVPGHKKGQPMLSDAEMMADVSFRITKNTKATIETWFNKAGVDAEMTEATINYLDYAFEDTTEQLCAAKWYLNGKISLPDEDEYKVRDAVKVAKQNKVDALSYASPMDILNTFGQPKSKVKPIDPDTVKELSNKKELAEGIVVYDVQDDFEGQAAVRKIIDTHWGEDANPWCLAARTNGDLERAKDMWLHYSKYPKRIAFRNGKLLAFYASANDKTWWDRNDEPHTNIPYSVKSKEGEYEVSTNYELKEGNKKAKKVSVGKSDKKGRTAYFVGNRLESAGIQDGERNLFYSSYSMGATLSDSTYGVGRSIEIQYGPYKNVTQISFERRTKDEPTYYVRVGYGNNGVRAISFVEGARSWDIRYGINGDQIFVGRAQLNFDLTDQLSDVYSGAYHMYRINDEEYEISRGTKKVGIVRMGEKVTMQMLEAFGEDGAPAGALLDFINDNGWNRADYPYPNPADADLLRRDDEVREQIRKVENEINEIAGGRYLSSVPAIRFRVTAEQDKAYMDAVEAGDMEAAQRMVDEAAKLAMPNTKVVDENGNPKVVYHGSTAMFTVFDKSRIGSATGTADGRGFYFTTDRDYALGYKTSDGQLFEVFLNIEKPLSYDKKTITKAQLRKILKEADRVEYEQEGEHYMLSNYANYNDVGIDAAVNEAANLEYDYADNDVELVGSLIGGSGSFDLIMDAVKKVTGKSGMIAPKDNGTIHYVVTDPAGIKSAEPVTYDNDGNVIPLSERFNPENADIRFRVRGENESTEEFIATEIPRFQGSYNVNAPIILMDYSSKESAARSLGIDVKDMPDYMYDNIKELAKENGGAYVKELNTILIFAQDYITTSGKADNVFFHEGTHSFITENPHWLALGEWLLDNAASETKKKIADVVRMAYEEDEYVEEMLTSYTGLMLSLGRSQAVMNSLPTEMKPIWEEILNKFNYIPEYEDTRRKSERAGDEDARRDAGVPMRNTDGEKAVRKGKISWKQPAGLTSKERRVINEYFPGAFRMTDSKGNTLTPAQEEFFANSKAVDKDGNLLVLYHGTPRAGFTEFESGWFTTSKEDAISYSGDRKGRMFDPNEKYEPETLVAGDFPLGYMTFDSEEDRAAFLAEYPEAESAISEAEFDSMTLQADEEYDDLIARKPELKKIWDAYREYERERFVDTTIGDIISNPEAYTEEDLMRAMLAYDSNASLDSLDDMDAAERKDALVSALQNANEETEGGILDMVVPTRVPRNGEGVKHNDIGNRTYEVYANVENPYEIDANGRGSEFESGDIYKSVEEALADEQYDGVIIRNWRVGRTQQLGDVVVPKNGSQIKLTINENPTESDDIRFSIRTKPAPKKTGIGYKVFYLKDGKLYPPMVANLGGVDTPVGVWLDAEEGTRAGVSKTGRPQVKQGGKGTQGGSGTLAYRPGWHLGEIPYAIQFNRKDENGDRTLFPADFVWAEVEYANDVDYQEEAMSYGMNANGKFQHSLAGLPKLPTDGSYKYRTNPNPETDPWIITGAMKVNRLLTPSEVDQMVIDAGREPQKRQEGAVTDKDINSLNNSLGLVGFSIKDIDSKREKLLNTESIPVTPLTIVGQKGVPGYRALEVALRWFQDNVKSAIIYNTEIGEVIFDEQSIRSSLGHKYGQTKLDAITSLAEGFKKATYLTSLNDFDGANIENAYFAYPISYNGETMYVICRTKKTKDYGSKRRIYIHEVFPESIIKEHTLHSAAGETRQVRGMLLYLDLLKEVLYGKDSDNIDTSNDSDENVSLRVTGTPTEDVVAEGVSLSPAQLASLAGDIFAALPEESRKKITDGLNGNILGLQDAIMQIPVDLATKEDWNDEDRQMAEVVAEQMTKVVGKEMTRPFSASEALWTLYNAVNKSTDLVSEASRALVRRNLGFDSQTLEMEKEAKDGVRFRTVGNASANAQASMYNRGAANVWTRLKESYVDMHASVEELVKAIEKRSGKVAQGFENILMALNQQSSKGLAAMEAYEQKFLNKMFDAIREIMDKTNFKYEDIVRYVILKHGLERNIKLAQRDARAHYQEIYDDIIAKIKGMNPAQKRTYLTNAQLRDADAKAELARLQAVNTSILTPDQLTDYKKEIAKAKKEAADAAEHLVRAQKIATMTEQDAQDELDKIFDNINNESDSVYKEMRKNDYSGISSMFYDTLGVNRKDYETEEEYQAALMQAKADKYDNLGDIEGAAQMEVTLFEKAVNTDKLWKSINKATKETLRQQYDANMISKDQYLNLRDMFEYYVPLRGFADNTAEDMYTYYRRPNSTGYTKPILGAEGRKTEAESPFGWIAAMAGSAIASNVKNEAKLALYYFVANRPDNGIATLSKTWFVHTPGDVDANGKKIFRPAYPPFNEDLSSASAKADYEVWQANMKNLQAQGLAYEAGQKLNLGNSVVNISDTNKPEHIVNVKVGGKDYTIVINGNPRAAQAINGDLNIEGTSQDYGALFGPVLRWMSSVNTSYNPEFWITNLMRDVAFTFMAVNIKEDPAYRRKFFKNYAKAFKVVSMVAKNEKGTLGNSYIENMYKDFVKYGGVTGYTQIKDSETWEKEIENYLASNDPASIRSGKVMRGMKSVFHVAHRFGESLEQVSRFAAFLTAVETGKSINEAINDAKEITVNFNRKGSGKMITLEEAKYLTDNNGQPLNKFEQWAAVGLSSIAPLGRRFIMFFNAAIQGLNATYKLYAKNKTRAIGWALGYAAVGMMNAVLHAMLDDDDDYLDIPQYERRNSLMIGGNGAYFKWALPQEARAFYALGDLAVESVMGRNPHQSVIGEALKISTEILPVNPSEGWKAFMPSVAIPFVELALNEDYKGAPIYNEQKWLTEEERERSTKWSKAYQGTGDLYVGIAKGLNAISGGDEHDAGLINLQPEKMEHIVQSAFGGTIRTADKLFTTIMAAFDPEEDVTVRQFPFLNRFLTINDERFKNVHVNDVYDYYAAEAEHAISLQKKYTKDRNADALKDLRSSDEYKWARIYSKYKKPIKKYQEAIRAADTTRERMDLMKQQDELKRKMIKEISEL